MSSELWRALIIRRVRYRVQSGRELEAGEGRLMTQVGHGRGNMAFKHTVYFGSVLA